MKKAMLVCLAAAVVVAAASCSGPVVTAVGESDDLIIIQDPDETPNATAKAVALMESPNTWLLEEPHFKTTVTSPSDAGDLRNRRQILVLGTWTGGDVERLVRSRLPGLRPGEPPKLYVDRDVWAKGQIVAAIMARNEDELTAFLEKAGPEVLARYENAAVERFVDKLRTDAESVGIEEELGRRFGWSLAPPTGYDFFTTHEGSRFVFFRRVRPDRTVSVYWQDGEAHHVTGEYATVLREEIAESFFEGDELMEARPLDVADVQFAGRKAVMLSGWWGNRTLIGGGPFRSYCFFDPSRKRVYLVDVMLFAPALDKVPLMRNLDVIANTFAVH